MHTVHVFKTYWPDTFGGVERVIDQLCRTDIAAGNSCEVVTLSRAPQPGGIAFNGHHVYSGKCDIHIASTPLSLTGWRLLSARIAKADIVHYHFPWPYMDIIHLLARPKGKTVVTYHADIIKQRFAKIAYRPLQDWFLNSVDEIYATSPRYLETSPVLRRFQDKVSIRPLQIDETSYPGAMVTQKLEHLNVLGRPFFFFVGVLRYYKGLHTLIEATKLLEERGIEVPVIIAGEGPEGARLKTQTQTLGVQSIQFAGSLDDGEKLALMDGCTAFVFPSHQRSEAFGVSLLEAAMRSRPMISCEIGTGTSYVNLDQVTGLVIGPESPEALADAMQTLLEQTDLNAHYGQAARTRFDALFSVGESDHTAGEPTNGPA